MLVLGMDMKLYKLKSYTLMNDQNMQSIVNENTTRVIRSWRWLYILYFSSSKE